MNRIAKRVALVLATLFVVTSFGIVVDAKVSSTTPRWIAATRDWAASGVTPDSKSPLTTLKRVLARSLSPAQGQAATVKTDSTSYLPGSTVVVTGTGFMPNEVIQLTFQEVQIQGGFVDAPIVFNPVADSIGQFGDTEYTTDNHHANVPVTVTAKGLVSGFTATTTFSNGAVIWTDENKYSLSQGIPIYGAGFTAGATITISVLRPDGVTDTVSPAPVAGNDGTFQTIYMPPPTKPGHYRITATDGNNQALTAVTEADPVALDKSGYDKGSASWGTGNQAGFNEGDWAQYQYTITGVGANVALPSFNVAFDYLTAGHIMVDAFSNFRICVDCPYPGSSNSVLANGVARPPSSTVGVGVANASGGTWYDFTPTGTINSQYNTGTSVCSGVDAVNTPTTPHCFIIDPVAIHATNANFPAVAPNSAGPFQGGTHHYTIFYEAHLGATFTWQSGNENQLGSMALPYGAIPPVDAVPNNAVYGTSQYSTWTTTAFLGSGGGGSNQHFYTDLGGKLTLPIPATTVPTGSIVITKVTTQSGAGAVFNFNLNSSSFVLDTDAATSTISNSMTFNNVVPGTYSVTEDAAPAGWAQTNLTCTTGGTVTSPTNPTATITMQNGLTVTCTYTNSKAGSIVLVKNTHGGDGSFAFSTTNAGGLTDTTLVTSGGTARQTFSNIDPSMTYSITETMPAGWQQGAATSCSSGTNTSFTVPFGTIVTCTFDNVKKGSIVLVKNTIGGDGAFAFTTTGGGGLSDTTLTTSAGTATQTFTNIDPSKTFSITENVPAGWQLTNSTCTTGAPASFTVPQGGTTTCTFTNRNQATIVLVKNTTGGDGTFTFTTTGGITNPASVSTTGGTGAVTFSNVDATKTYSIAENVPTGWQQTGTPSCTGQASGTVGGFVPTAGGTVTCTFANLKQASIVLVKNTHGGDGSFAFTTTGGGGFSNTTLTTTGGTTAQTFTNIDPTKTFSVTEAMPAGWQIGLATTCSTGTNSSFTVAAGGTTTCTFDNTKQASIVLVKNTIGGDGSFAFTTTGGGNFSNTTLTTSAGTAAQTFTNVDPTKTFSVTEAMPAGWQIGAATTCTTGTNTSFTVAAGGTTTCTFSNTKQSTIVLVKNTHGGDGSFAFTTTGGGNFSNTTLTTSSSTASQTFTNIDPTKTYSVTESMPAGWQIGAATVCTTGLNTSFTVAAGGTTTCTFDNVKQSTIVLVKNTVGGDGSFAFTTTGGGNLTNTTLTTSSSTATQTFTNIDSTKTYSIAEPSVTGWQLSSSNCTSGAPGSFTVPAGGTVTCTFTNTKQSTIVLVKNTHGGNGSFAFTTTGGGGLSNTTLTTSASTAAQTFTNIDPTQTFSITEPAVIGWQTGLAPNCVGQATGNVGTFTIAAGATVTCTFDNVKQSTIVLVKNTHGSNGSFAFTTTGGGGLSNTTLTTAASTASQTFTNVDPTKTFSITEVMPAGWQQGLAPSCTTGLNTSFTVAAGGSTTCTFDNVKQSTIVLVKNTIGGDGSFAFTTTGGGGLTNTTLTTSSTTAVQTFNNIDPTKTFSIAEATTPGWELTNSSCTSGAPASFTVAAGGSVTCTFTNTKLSGIILVKNTHGGNGSFAFTTTNLGGGTTTLTTVASTASQTYTNVDPNVTYNFSETMPAGWQLGAAPVCVGQATGGTSNGTPSAPGVSGFTVPAGGSVTCTFDNVKQSTIVLVKNTHGGDGSFAFTTTGGGGFSNTTLTTASSTASQTYTNVDPTKTFSVTEAMPTGWQTGAATVCTTGIATSFTVSAGGTTTCTFDNTKQATIVLVKNTHGGDGSFAFTTTGGGNFSNTTLTTVSGTKAQTYTNVDPTKTFSVTEAMPAGWQIGLATTCTTGLNTSFTVAPGGTTTCTFDNTKLSTIVLVKNTLGGNGTFAFTTTGGGGLSNTTLTTSASTATQTYTNIDPTHTFTIVETEATGWGPNSAPVCTGQTSGGTSNGTPSFPGVSAFTLAAGSTVTCTFVNTKNPQLTLTKHVSNSFGGALSTDFTMTGTGPTPISFAGTVTSGPGFQAGVYTLGETNRTGYLSGIWSCLANNGTPAFNIGNPGALNTAITGLGPIAFWRFNELGGSTFADAAGPHTLTMPTVDFGSPGAIGGTTTGLAVVNGRARMTPISVPSGAATFEWWLEPMVQGGDGYGTLFEDSQNFGNGFYLQDVGGGKVKVNAFFFSDQVNNTALNTDGTAYHIVATVTGTSGQWYVNGVPDGTFTYSALNIDRILNNEAPEPLQVSLIDEVAIYPATLSAGTVAAHYAQGIANAPATYQSNRLLETPTAYWKFEETGGGTLADASGHGNTLTIPSVTYGVIGDTIGSTGLAMTNAVASMTPIPLVAGPVSFSWVLKPLVQGGDGYGTLLEDSQNFGNGFYLHDNGSGKVFLDAFDYVHNDQHNNTPLNTDGTLYHIVASIDGSGHGTWYVNGVADGTFTYFSGGYNVDRAFQNEAYEALHVSLIDRMAIFPLAVSGAQALAQYNLATAQTTVTLGPGDVASCDITNTDQDSHLKLVKVVNTDNGGTAVPTDFWLAANGPTPFFGKGTVEQNVFSGVYRLRELNRPGYTAGTWNCTYAPGGLGSVLNGNILTLSAGDNATCTIINSDNPPALTLVKQVNNTHGGTAVAAAWTVTANGGGLGTISGSGFVTSGSTFKTGTYALSESGGPGGYSAGSWNCVGGTMGDATHITVGLGQSATCTIINSDVAPSLTLVKQVITTHGGTAVAANWLLSASAGPSPISGQGGAVSDGTFQQGTYFLSESGGPNGYTASAWNCTGTGSQSGSNITLGLGQSAVCTIVNSDIAPILTLVKGICNDNGGTAVASSWTLSATGGPTPISGPGGVISSGAFIAGTYTLAESAGVPGYAPSAWTCDGGQQNGNSITIGIGQAVTCAIENDDIAPTLTLNKIVSNTHGGGAVPANWLLQATGPTAIAGFGTATSGGNFSAGTYTLIELGGPATYTPSLWTCNNGVTVTAGQITLPLAKVTTCSITNSDVPATLIVKKVIINDNGGQGVASNFSFKVNGGSTIPFTGSGSTSSVTMTVNAGTYDVVETAAPGYTTTYTNCSNLILFNGATGTCTITNNDNVPSLIETADTTRTARMVSTSFTTNGNAVPLAHKPNSLTFFRP